MEQHKVIIIGGGFAGLSALLTIRKQVPHAAITLFDKDEYCEYTPSLHYAITRPKFDRRVLLSLKEHYGDYYIQQEIIAITQEYIEGADGQQYEYDYLVIAVGSRPNFFGNASFEKFGVPLRRFNDMVTIRKRLPAAQTVTVIGGGYTGVEVASMLAVDTTKHIHLIHAADRLLEKLSPAASRATQRYLEKKGVTVVTNTMCKELQENTVVLESGSVIRSDLVIVNIGMQPNDTLFGEPFDVSDSLEVRSLDRVYVCGDAARSGTLPTAHNAMLEGRLVGHQVASHIMGTKPPSPRQRHWNVLAIALGAYDGIITLGARWAFRLPYLTGFGKWLIEKRVLFEFKYKRQLPL